MFAYWSIKKIKHITRGIFFFERNNYRDIIGDKNVKSIFSEFKNISAIETGQNYP
jgi:hypothetical protein